MDPFAELVGESAAIEAVREQIRRLVARRETGRRLPSVLLQGETGSGKGLVARMLHRVGPRARAPFVDLNCAAMPEHLVESELFGYERGAFTDARRSKPGLFLTAHRGVIFLDEIGELTESTQAKLLKVLEEGVVRRLGATGTEPADVWVISATNADLETAVRQRTFREDLYHRLAVLTLRLPPLRERGRDVILLAARFLNQACTEYGLSPKKLTPEAEERILRYPWPGNVRELDNLMERVALLAEGDNVTASMLELRGSPEAPRAAQAPVPASASLEEAMRDHLLAALEQTRWNISQTAALLDISRNTVRARIDRFGLRPSPGRASKSRRSPPAPSTVPVSADAPAARRSPAPTGPAVPIRWDSRRITFLRARLLRSGDDELLLEAHRALDVVLEKAQSFGGHIEELSPQGIGAVFGLDPVEDAPRRAAHAAMAIQKAAERGRREGAQGFTVKTGIHVGEVLVGHDRVGPRIDAESERGHWTTLDRMLGEAGPGITLVSDTAMPFLERHFELVSELGLSVSAHRLQGRERKGLAPEGQMAGFVGRGLELSLLTSRLAATKAGNGQVVGIVGEAGIGKSRLLHEFRQVLRGESVTYLEGHCLSYGGDIPYLPVLEVLRRACRIGEEDPPDRVRRRVHRTLQQLGLPPDESAPYLMRFLGIKEATEQLDGVTPEAIRTHTMQILCQMCLTSTRQRPLVIVMEDLHWVDPASESLGSLLSNFSAMPLMLIFTYRPEYRPSWLDTSHVTQLSLPPLSAEESMSLLRSILPPERLTEPDAREILVKAEGNPFFLEELGRTVREQGALATRASVPHTVQAVILARINRLADRERRVLQSAAVIGTDVPARLLRVIADLAEPELNEALARLRGSEFIYESSLGPEAAFTFKHALTHEVAYGTLPEPDRRRLHARIVGALEALGEPSPADFLDRYAHHAYEGQLWEKAARELNQAALRAFARSANREAVALFERALEAVGHLPHTPESLSQAVDLHLGIRNALTLLGDVRRTLEHLRQAATLAERLGDQPRLGRAYSFAANALYLSGDQRGAITAGERALRIAEALSDFRLRTATSIYLGRAYQALGDYRRALSLFHEVVDSLQGNLMRDHLGLPVLPAVFARSLQAWCLGETGQFSDGSRLAEEAIRLAESTNHPDTRLWAYRGAGLLELARGGAQQAAIFLERARDVCRTHELPVYVPVIDSELGHAYAMLGRTDEALPLLEEAVQQATGRKQVAILAQMMLRLGDGKLRVGLVDEAASIGARALDLCQRQEDQGTQAHARHLLGEVERLRGVGHLDAAEGHYLRAVTLAEGHHMRPLMARCRLGLGLLRLARGDHAQAKAHLTEAVGSFREMGMPGWLEEGVSTLKSLW